MDLIEIYTYILRFRYTSYIPVIYWDIEWDIYLLY